MMQQESNLAAQPVEARNRVSRLDAGEAGIRQGAAIKFRAGLLGCVARGSLGYLKPGPYQLALEIRSLVKKSPRHNPGILIELITCSRLISVHVLATADLGNPHHKFVIDVPEPATDVELRISALSSVEATIHDVAVDPFGSSPPGPRPQVVRLQNWLPLLDVGTAGKRPEFGTEAEMGVTEALEGRSGFVICGPRWPLEPGRYSVTAAVELSNADSRSDAIGRLEVTADTIPIASADIQANQAVGLPIVLPFEVAGPASKDFPPLIEFRIFSQGTDRFRIRSIAVEPEWPTATAGIRNNLVARTKIFLSRPLEHATTRSVAPLVGRLEAAIMRQIEQIEDRERQLNASIINRLENIEDRLAGFWRAIQVVTEQQREMHETIQKLDRFQAFRGLAIGDDLLLRRYGSVPPLHPVGNWRMGIGLDKPTNLLKERVRKWNELSEPAVLLWHADLQVVLWPGNETSRQLFVTGELEPSEMSWLSENLKNDMVFIDVGANMGIHTMFAAKLVGTEGRVLAIEPSEREFQRLSFHVALNGLGNVSCLRFAAGAEVGTAELKVAGEEKSGQNTLGDFITHSTELLRVETVPTYPLDQLIAENKLARVDVIKIDAEGAELDVLSGLAGTLGRWRPKLLVELAPDSLTAQGTSPEALIERLRASGYELFEFSRSTGELEEFRIATVEHGSKNFVAIAAE